MEADPTTLPAISLDPSDSRNPNRAPIRTSKSPPSPFSVEPPSEPPKPPVVFSVTGSRGEGSLEYHQDPHLGNSAVDPTLAVRVSWCRRGDVAAATTTVEPPSEYSEDRTSKTRTTAVLPRRPVLALLPRRPIFRPCHSFSPSVQLQPLLTAQGTRHSSHRVRRRSTFIFLHHRHSLAFSDSKQHSDESLSLSAIFPRSLQHWNLHVQILQGNMLNSLLIQICA
ncbi:hypothetical protein PIB30_090928 [Stylosanthes scabra]|uniref:Uncharacterized protein n=1 Tax=Stylosanthes scabra TaxID=79078 RepID=A0ABU6UT70_9FABA|nr:hypothetical protein [Stylosanthes scabra]